jgi:hypothetical protein
MKRIIPVFRKNKLNLTGMVTIFYWIYFVVVVVVVWDIRVKNIPFFSISNFYFNFFSIILHWIENKSYITLWFLNFFSCRLTLHYINIISLYKRDMTSNF